MKPTTPSGARIWVSHPTGNTNVRAAVEAFDRNGLLEAFHTCIGLGFDNANPVAKKLFGQRRCPLPSAKIKTLPTRETMRLLLQRTGVFPALRRHETGPFCIDRIYRELDAKVAGRLRQSASPPTAVFAYEDAAEATFRAAAEVGVKRIYDLPIGYWRAARRIQTEEAERLPEWAGTMEALRDSGAKLERKDEELSRAEAIFVASRFTAKTLKEAPFDLPEPVVIPYGCPTPRGSVEPPADSSAPLKALYVGGLSQRKGLAYLIRAADRLGKAVELTFVGKRIAPCPPLDAALRKHRWIDSLPHPEILKLMRTHDVFVFPSLFEGFGLVLTEALSQGLPVVATAHTCAPDLIEDGRQGFIVPIRDADAIASHLHALHEDRGKLHAMKIAALETARAHTWQSYRDGLVTALRAFLS